MCLFSVFLILLVLLLIIDTFIVFFSDSDLTCDAVMRPFHGKVPFSYQ